MEDEKVLTENKKSPTPETSRISILEANVSSLEAKLEELQKKFGAIEVAPLRMENEEKNEKENRGEEDFDYKKVSKEFSLR